MLKTAENTLSRFCVIAMRHETTVVGLLSSILLALNMSSLFNASQLFRAAGESFLMGASILSQLAHNSSHTETIEKNMYEALCNICNLVLKEAPFFLPKGSMKHVFQ